MLPSFWADGSDCGQSLRVAGRGVEMKFRVGAKDPFPSEGSSSLQAPVLRYFELMSRVRSVQFCFTVFYLLSAAIFTSMPRRARRELQPAASIYDQYAWTCASIVLSF